MAVKLVESLELMKACLMVDEMDCKLAEWLVRWLDTCSVGKLDYEMAVELDSLLAASTDVSMGRR